MRWNTSICDPIPSRTDARDVRGHGRARASGDDVYGEDPTVNRLQEMAAEMMGKEAGLFVPSGTMGNLAALLSHCQTGDEVILGNKNHTFLFEAGGMSALGGIHSMPAAITSRTARCCLRMSRRRSVRTTRTIRSPDLICLENTHNRCGGTVQTPEYTRQLAELAHNRWAERASGRSANLQRGSRPCESVPRR